MKQPKINCIEELIESLSETHPDKECAFRVSTWLMILKEIQKILDESQEIKEEIQIDLQKNEVQLAEVLERTKQTNLSTQDADTILF